MSGTFSRTLEMSIRHHCTSPPAEVLVPSDTGRVQLSLTLLLKILQALAWHELVSVHGPSPVPLMLTLKLKKFRSRLGIDTSLSLIFVR